MWHPLETLALEHSAKSFAGRESGLKAPCLGFDRTGAVISSSNLLAHRGHFDFRNQTPRRPYRSRPAGGHGAEQPCAVVNENRRSNSSRPGGGTDARRHACLAAVVLGDILALDTGALSALVSRHQANQQSLLGAVYRDQVCLADTPDLRLAVTLWLGGSNGIRASKPHRHGQEEKLPRGTQCRISLASLSRPSRRAGDWLVPQFQGRHPTGWRGGPHTRGGFVSRR